MMRWIWVAAAHAIATAAAWYFVSAAAQGAADGTGTAPLWLSVLNGCASILIWPLGRLALSLDPFWGDFSTGGFLRFSVVTALNSAAITAVLWLLFVGVRRLRTAGRDHRRGHDQTP